MFKEIETEIMHILNDDPMEKLAHQLNADMGKLLAILYDIKYNEVDRVYIYDPQDIGLDKGFIYVIINDECKLDDISTDTIVKNGKAYDICFIPNKLIDTAFNVCHTVVNIVSLRVFEIIKKYNCKPDDINSFTQTLSVAIPVITCTIMRTLYAGESLPLLILNTIKDVLEVDIINETGINSALAVVEEGIGVYDLLDNGYILLAKNNKKYPELFKSTNKENKEE